MDLFVRIEKFQGMMCRTVYTVKMKLIITSEYKRKYLYFLCRIIPCEYSSQINMTF